MQETRILTRAPESDVAKLICKLRWLGMEDEAHRLQEKTRDRSRGAGAVAWLEPHNTD
jgi:hypothetical protein